MDRLEWDSNFWEIDVHRLGKNDKLTELNKFRKQQRSFLIEALLPVGEMEKINRLEDQGFRFVETKLNLEKKIEKEIPLHEGNFKKVKLEDVEIYKDDFHSLFGAFSRFRMFDKGKVNEFYYLWAANSIEAKMDDHCIGYYMDGILAGLITYKVKKNLLTIGLLGVFQNYQRKGIGQQLLDWVNNEAFKKQCLYVGVSTQGNNLRAANAYLKNGYHFKDIENWYYLKEEYNDKF